MAFVDADCLPRPGWLQGLLPHLVDPDVALVAPRIVSVEPDGGAAGVVARYEASRSALDLGDRPARVRARSRVSFVPSAALLGRVDVLREVGGFDVTMAVGEDVDLVWRLDEAGHCVRYEPGATVAHRHRTTLRAWARRRFDYGTSAGPLAVRHPGALVPVEATVWSVTAWGLAVAGHPVLGLGVAGGTVADLARKLGSVEDAPALAVRLAGQGHLAAGKLLAQAVVRPWWPVSLVLAAVVPSRPAAPGPAAGRDPAAHRGMGHRAPVPRTVDLRDAASHRRHRLQQRRVGRRGAGPHRRAAAPGPHVVAEAEPVLEVAGEPVASSMSSRIRDGGRCCS